MNTTPLVFFQGPNIDILGITQVNDWITGTNPFSIVTSDQTTPITISGIADGTPGMFLSFLNGTSTTLSFTNLDNNSLSINQFYLRNPTQDIGPQGMVSFVYLSSITWANWTCVSVVP